MRTELSSRPGTHRRSPTAALGRAERGDAQAILILHRSARALLGELPLLTDRVVAALYEEQPAYRATGAADARALWTEVRESLRHSIAALLQTPHGREESRAHTRSIGTSRARAGFPLDAMLHAYRLGGVLVWERLLETAGRRDTSEVRLLIHIAADVWNFVDQHCVIIADAYRQVERETAWREERRLRQLIRALLDGATKLADVPEAAAALGLPESGSYAVVAIAGRSRAQARPARNPHGMRILWHATDPGRSDGTPDFGIALLGKGTPAALGAALRGRDGLPPGARVGVSSAVTGLAAIGEARRLAETALRVSPPTGGIALLDDHVPAALVLSAPDLAAALVGRFLGPLLDLPPGDRDLLLDTLTAWLACDGSAPRAAERLYCHRNTVLNRLRRYEQLTERSLSRPDDLVQLSLALTARRLLATSG